MKIDRAIKNLEAGREDCGMIPPEEFTATIDLAIEALKYVKSRREKNLLIPRPTLPSETIY